MKLFDELNVNLGFHVHDSFAHFFDGNLICRIIDLDSPDYFDGSLEGMFHSVSWRVLSAGLKAGNRHEGAKDAINSQSGARLCTLTSPNPSIAFQDTSSNVLFCFCNGFAYGCAV